MTLAMSERSVVRRSAEAHSRSSSAVVSSRARLPKRHRFFFRGDPSGAAGRARVANFPTACCAAARPPRKGGRERSTHDAISARAPRSKIGLWYRLLLRRRLLARERPAMIAPDTSVFISPTVPRSK